MPIFRSTPPPTREELQTMLDHGRSAWMPGADEGWSDFVTRKAPPAPTFWSIGPRASYKAALEEALRQGERRVAHDALIFPLWIGNNEDEEARDDTWRRHVVVWSEGEVILEAESEDGPTFWARARLTVVTGAFVGMARSYAPGIPVQRVGPYAVTRGIVRTVVDDVIECTSAPALLAPAVVVPAFSALVEPAAAPHALPADVTSAIEAAVTKLQILQVVVIAFAVGCTAKATDTSTPPAVVSVHTQASAIRSSDAAPPAPASATSAILPLDDCSGADLESGKCRCAHQRCMDICCPDGWICSHHRSAEGGFAKCLRP